MSADEAKLQELIEKFKKDESFYKTAAYNEANCRLEFLDPLFKILNCHDYAKIFIISLF